MIRRWGLLCVIFLSSAAFGQNAASGQGAGASQASAPGIISGQISEELVGSTKLDTLQFRRGQIIVVDRYPVGNIYGQGNRVEVEAVVTSDPMHPKEMAKGIILRLTNGREANHSRSASMDVDEVIEASRALAKISELSVDAAIKGNSQIAYRTKNDISIGYARGNRQAYAFVSIGIMRVPGSGLAEYLTGTFDGDELGTLRMLFDKATDLLSTK